MLRLTRFITIFVFFIMWISTGCDKSVSPDPDEQTSPTHHKSQTERRIEFLQDYAISLMSLDPDDQDYSDYEPFKTTIGDKRIVMLREPDHGNGSAFLAKTRMIKFLHQEMGFDVLAMESGMYDCQKSWEALQNGEYPVTAARKGIFGVWTLSEQFQPMIEYLGQTANSANPLEVAGFDCQPSGTAADSVFSEFDRYMTEIQSPFTERETWPLFIDIMNKVLGYYWYLNENEPLPDWDTLDMVFNTLLELPDEIESRGAGYDAEKAAFWAQIMRGYYILALRDLGENWRPDNPIESHSSNRDQQMGRNFVWLARNRYVNRKIIVWAATFHIGHNFVAECTYPTDISWISDDTAVFSEATYTMGERIYRELGQEVYSLGFSGYKGNSHWYNGSFNMHMTESYPGSFEDLLYKAGFEHAILNFQNPPEGGGWIEERNVSHMHGYWAVEANWTRIVDGMLFTAEFGPSDRAESSFLLAKLGIMDKQLTVMP